MKNSSRGNILLAALIFVAITLTVVGGAYFWQIRPSQPPTKPPVAEATPTIPAEETAGWRTYANEIWSVRLPPGTRDFGCDQSSCRSISTQLRSGTTLTAKGGGPGTVEGGGTWGEVVNYLKERKIPYTEKVVSGRAGVWVRTTSPSFDPFLDYGYNFNNQSVFGVVLPQEENRWLSLYIYRTDADLNLQPLSSEDRSTFDQILATFKFLD